MENTRTFVLEPGIIIPGKSDASLQQEQSVTRRMAAKPLSEIVRPSTEDLVEEPVPASRISEILQLEEGIPGLARRHGVRTPSAFVPHETVTASGGVGEILQLE